MATCGYVCPLCEGKGVDEEGKECKWCSPTIDIKVTMPKHITDSEWLQSVHEGKCCSDD